jgi:uncharacterized protein
MKPPVRAATNTALLLLTFAIAAPNARSANDGLPLIDAVKSRNITRVREVLDQRVSAAEAESDGSSALAWAAHLDFNEAVNLLIKAGADVNSSNDYGITPLTLACTNSNAAIAEALMNAGADANKSQWAGETPLMTCTRTGVESAVKVMLARGANVNAATRRGQTALMWAAAQKRPRITQMLLQAGANVNAVTRVPEGFTPLSFLDYGLRDHTSGKADTHDKTKTHHDPASSRGGYTPLLFAARSGDEYSARLFIEAGADVNYAGPDGPPLLVAAASGHEQLALFFAENGADVKARDGFGMTALHWAVQEGLASITAAKVQAPTDGMWYHPNMPGLAKALIAKGADVNARVGKGVPPWDFPPYAHGGGIALPQIRHVGATPFLLAAAGGDVDMMRLLLASGANPKMGTEEGTTPLMAAAGVGQLRDRPVTKQKSALEAVLLTIELGNEVKATAAGNRTALHGAAQIGANDVIELLVKHGADINAKDKYGQTPLSIALGDPERLVDPFDKRFRQQPQPHKATAELLLSLGATPLASEASKVGAGKVSAPSRYPSGSQ